ncbi:hypothetical protein [Verrucosispora sioxanthis]|uniref:hypothetical protein n=1 Tax=Verrucosispora sioxanthis TaxID=2499994 RepID=UPI00209C8FFF|nr:hypothetical protein [Verrucosispora sioxanthis]
MSGVPVPAEVVQVARKRLTAAAEEFDRSRISALVVELAEEWGVVRLWDDVCVPVLTAFSGRAAVGIAIEHALSEGVRAGLDVFRRDPGVGLPTDGVLLAGAEQEEHCLGLHALAAALRERGQGCLLVGPALPWTALAVVPHRPVRPGVPGGPGVRRRARLGRAAHPTRNASRLAVRRPPDAVGGPGRARSSPPAR